MLSISNQRSIIYCPLAKERPVIETLVAETRLPLELPFSEISSEPLEIGPFKFSPPTVFQPDPLAILGSKFVIGNELVS